MAEEVILSAIEMLESWLLDNSEMKEEYTTMMEEMKNNLKLILDFLKDSAPSRNKLLNYLTADVVEIAHDARISIRKMGPDVVICLEMRQIRRRLRKLKAMMLNFESEGGQGAEPPAPLDGDVVVGLEETVESLLRQKILKNDRQTFSSGLHTLRIVGVGGIGKTTLARELYNHADVAARFPHRAWVCVSGLMSNKQVLMELIVQVAEGVGFELLEEMDNRSLQQMLHQLLQSKPYFIVLDDVDEDPYMRSVLKALTKDEGSRLLITSQSRNEMLGTIDYYHKMKFLDEDESWKLFLKTFFCGNTIDKIFPKKFEKMGRKMLKQCGGLPLAIIEMGRQLAVRRNSGREWEELLESPIDFHQTLASLGSSYVKLPPKEKSIFLCLSFFEEGTTIRVQKLLQIGISQGVIGSELEGRLSLLALDERSFIDCNGDYKGLTNLKYARVRIIFHRLSVARAKEEINFEILRNDGDSPSCRKPFHRAIYCDREKFNCSNNREEHLVSLFFRGGGNFDDSPSHWQRFARLIILDMEGFGLKMVPDSIGLLTRLKYLGLRNNHIQKLPPSLSCLKNLEVLDIALNFMIEVPDIIWEMNSLRHLYTSDIIFTGSLKIDALENLESLTYVSVEDWTYELSGLQMMNKLRKLGFEEVDGKSNVSKLFASLVELKNLDGLILRGFRFKCMPLLDEIGILHRLTTLKLDGLLVRLPSANNFPPNMSHLTLVNSSLVEDPMPVLERLPKLIYLRLQNAYTGRQMVISNDGFQSLEYIDIKEFWHLRNLQVGKLAMPFLIQLEINDCPYLETLSEEKRFKIVKNQKNCKVYQLIGYNYDY